MVKSRPRLRLLVLALCYLLINSALYLHTAQLRKDERLVAQRIAAFNREAENLRNEAWQLRLRTRRGEVEASVELSRYIEDLNARSLVPEGQAIALQPEAQQISSRIRFWSLLNIIANIVLAVPIVIEFIRMRRSRSDRGARPVGAPHGSHARQ